MPTGLWVQSHKHTHIYTHAGLFLWASWGCHFFSCTHWDPLCGKEVVFGTKDPSQTQKSQPCVPAGGVHSGKAKAWAGDCHRFWKVHVSQTSPEQPILNRQPSPPSFLCGQFPEHLLHPRLQEGRQRSTVRALSPKAHGESGSHIRGVGAGRRGAGSQITSLKRL